MKKCFKKLLFCIFIFAAFNANAQEKYATYENLYAKEAFQIYITTEKKEKYSLYIDAFSLDKLNERGGIVLNQKQHQEFLSALTEAKLKYEEWVKTAKDNNVEDLSKAMTVKCVSGGYFLYGSKWHFQFYVNLKFEFRIYEHDGEVKYYLLIKTGELKSSSNQFMKVDGFLLVFSSSKEIDEFASIISAEKISEYLTKPKTEDLFKN